jgi:hypothetical protein
MKFQFYPAWHKKKSFFEKKLLLKFMRGKIGISMEVWRLKLLFTLQTNKDFLPKVWHSDTTGKTCRGKRRGERGRGDTNRAKVVQPSSLTNKKRTRMIKSYILDKF